MNESKTNFIMLTCKVLYLTDSKEAILILFIKKEKKI